MNQTTTKSRVSRPSSTEAVQFTDGMLVTADDLQAAMHYPLSVVQVLLRSYFGCGIVCGLKVTDPNEGRPQDTRPGCEPERGYVVKVGPGVALGCDGYPIELCSELKLDLSPDPCGCPVDATETRFLAIRRERAAEPSGRGGCGGGCGCDCGSGSGSQQQCTRQRDHILVQAFPAAPTGACMNPPRSQDDRGECEPADTADEPQGLCECMHECADCDRCAEPWVVIAILEVDGDGIVAGSINRADLVETEGGRRYVKPIACLCEADAARSSLQSTLNERYRNWEDRLGMSERRITVVERAGTVTKPGEWEDRLGAYEKRLAEIERASAAVKPGEVEDRLGAYEKRLAEIEHRSAAQPAAEWEGRLAAYEKRLAAVEGGGAVVKATKRGQAEGGGTKA